MSLLLQTRRALPSKMKAEIIEIFGKATERTGMSGTVSFNVQREFPPLPVADLIRTSGKTRMFMPDAKTV